MAILLVQAATASGADKPKGESWSILEPVGNEPCRPASSTAEKDQDIIVCGQPLPSQTLPYPNEVIPKGPRRSNPDMRATTAMNAETAPCTTQMKGCTVGFGPPIVPIIAGAVDLAKRAFAKRPDKTGRVPIDLDAPMPASVILP